MSRRKVWGEAGYTFVELVAVMVILSVVTVASLSYLRSSAPLAVSRLVQVAMVRIATEEPNMKYPLAVTVTDLRNHGLGSLIDDYTINAYARTGTPTGTNYEMELEAPNGTTLFCITESIVTQAACS